MANEITTAITEGIDALRTEIKGELRDVEKKAAELLMKAETAVKANGDIAPELKSALEKQAETIEALNARMREIEQKGVSVASAVETRTIGEQFAFSDQFKSMRTDEPTRCRIEVKNTILSNGNTVLAQQIPGVTGGAFKPLTIYGSLPHAPASGNSVEGIREASFTNSAAEVAEGALKPESDLTFEPHDYHVRTIPHWLKVSKNLLADAPAVAAYIDNRLTYGVMERVDRQLMVGNGTSPNLSGILDSGNYTVYTPTSDDNLIDAINRAKWQLWAAGWVPDNAYVNPQDWGDMELQKGSDGHYLNGLPGMMLNTNPFNVRIIPSPFVPRGQFAIGAFARAVTVWDRQSVTVEVGYADDDFIKNLVTLRAEMRMAFEISTPSAILGGAFTA
jgi:HK97 family phage major capsid protein